MVVLGRRLGGLAVAVCMVACVKKQEPVAEPQPATSTAAANDHARPVSDPKPARRLETPAPAREHNPTCIAGSIKTADRLEIPVARARISIIRNDTMIGDATTDDNGRFSWCTPKAFEGLTVRTSIRVEKTAFAKSERDLELAVGTTAEVNIGLHAAE